MFYLFNLRDWSWDEIKTFMHNNGGIPTPILFKGNGWVKMTKGYVLWDSKGNGASLSEVPKQYVKNVLKWATVPKRESIYYCAQAALMEK